MSDYAIGIDLGGTNVKALAVNVDGAVLGRERFGTEDDPARKWIERIKSHIAEIESSRGPASAVGVACPGLASTDGRTIRWMMHRLESVMGLDWTTALGRSTTVPVMNDAQAALLGEVWQGAARGADNAVLLTLGTGVGGAILCDGRILRGHMGRAGHLGHLSLDPEGRRDIVNTPGSLEDAIGECTLGRRGGGRYASTRDLVQAVRAGDAAAEEIWLSSVRALAAGMASIANAVDPEVFILGGGIARAGEELLRPLREYLDQFEWRPTGTAVRVVLAALGDEAGAIGAAKNALDRAAEGGNA